MDEIAPVGTSPSGSRRFSSGSEGRENGYASSRNTELENRHPLAMFMRLAEPKLLESSSETPGIGKITVASVPTYAIGLAVRTGAPAFTFIGPRAAFGVMKS